MIFKSWKFQIISNVNNIIIYCCRNDTTQKNETRRRENLFKYIGNIIEKADVYICKSATVLVRLPNTRKKSYLKNDWCVHWSFKKKQTLRDITLSNKTEAANFKFNKVMSQNEHGIECTPVIDASVSVSRTSARYAFMRFFCFFNVPYINRSDFWI